ncbi:aminoglycoside phosphotransferase family protein [Streptomyces sp. NBC_00178]|uniref:aminoglycoside phosphotransferase family protein n=1 Tax=Streptomyces sp. NBC_00178 TaxID=2975672 RepID=UPI002E2B84C0|nr:aminoglycoside phosphotransferase family protein [Streptomyces sp. NBC_00178]
MDTTEVTPEVRERLAVRFGPEAHAWCDRLPTLVERLSDRWGLDVHEAGGGGTSRVFRCTRREDGTLVRLKLTPDPVVAAEEAEGLAAWAGTASVVTLLAEDPGSGALLLAEVRPGTPVLEAGWSLPQVGALLRGLRMPAAVPRRASVLRPLARRVEFLFELTARRAAHAGPHLALDRTVCERSREAALRLASSGPMGLVHGDLHPGNVLTGPEGRAVAIDPRPALGDPDFDAVDWVLAGAEEMAGLTAGIDGLARLVPGLSQDRVLAWCRALAVLEAVPRLRTGRDDPTTRFLLSLGRP